MRNHAKYSILLGAVGTLFIGLYFYLSSISPVSNLFRQKTTREAILQQANAALARADLLDLDLARSLEMEYDQDLLVYAQRYNDSQLPEHFFPITIWRVTWQGKIETKKALPEDVSLSVTYDNTGRLVGMEFVHPELNRPPNYKESQALRKAKAYLREQHVDVNSLTLSNKSFRKDNRVLTHSFTFTKRSPVAPNLEEYYEINVTGRTPSYYRAHIVSTTEILDRPKTYKTALIISVAVAGILWAALGLLVVTFFLKRLKRDVIEFKRGIWFSLGVFILTATSIVIESWPDMATATSGR